MSKKFTVVFYFIGVTVIRAIHLVIITKTMTFFLMFFCIFCGEYYTVVSLIVIIYIIIRFICVLDACVYES